VRADRDSAGADGLIPAYDVNPAAHASIRGHVPKIVPPVRILRPSLADVARDALVAPLVLWKGIRADARISDGVRGVAEERLVRLGQLELPAVRGPNAFGR